MDNKKLEALVEEAVKLNKLIELMDQASEKLKEDGDEETLATLLQRQNEAKKELGDVARAMAILEVESNKYAGMSVVDYINIQDNKGWSALMYAVKVNNIVAIKKLLEEGANKDLKSKDDQTAMDIAISIGNLEAMELLSGH